MKYTVRSPLFILISLLFLTACQKKESVVLQLSNLRTEMLVNPLGIGETDPKLSWEISGDRRGIIQTAYRILAASSSEKLSANEGDLWDSGKVLSGSSINVLYEGAPLKSRMRCYWKVKVWSAYGESDWSEPAYWSMGLLHEIEWQGIWIGLDKSFQWDDEGIFSRLSARYLRKDFEVTKEIKRATVYIIGLGLYELYINGQKIGDQVLAPSPTDFIKNVKYNVFDITDKIQPGNNAAGVILGNGRYFTMRNYKAYKIKNFSYPKMLFQLEVEYSDGSVSMTKSDETWKITADGPIRSNNEYDGEEYDARKEMPEWSMAGYDAGKWLNAGSVQEPGGRIEAQMNENMKVIQSIKPISVTRIRHNTYIMDLGQNIAGWIRMKVKGNRGDRVKLRFAEILTDKGELSTYNLRDALATDIYILKGGGEEIWEPSFVYHGFRYVEISGYPGVPDIEDFEGRVVSDDIKTIGTFETSDEITNRLFRNAWWGILGNYKGMPVDCPQRNERQPWLGDRAVVSYSESFIFDNLRLYRKWLDDIYYTQKADGAICDVAPAYFKYYSDNMTWPGTYLLVADMIWNKSGDKSHIVKYYASMKKWLEYMRDRYMTETFIVTKDSYGDWCVPPVTIEAGRGKSANVKYPSKLISTAYYYYFMGIMQRFARLSGNDQDIAGFADLAGNIRKGFNDEFYNPESHSYGENTLTDNLLPVYFGIVLEDQKAIVMDNIIKIIEITNNGHLSCGVIGVQWLMRTLTENGRSDLAFRIATNTTYPGWGYMIENGATTIWELWNGNTAAPDMNSYNHVMMLGDLIIWYFENLAGIKSGPEKPGFSEIIMKPEIIDGLDFVKASYNSVHGIIKSEWRKEGNKFYWDLTIPGNSKAVIGIPSANRSGVSECGKKASGAEGIRFLEMQDGRAMFEIGSGEYHFISESGP